MSVFDNLTKGVKDFFIEEEAGAASKVPASASAPAVAPVAPLAGLAPGMSQPEQRHLDHIAQVLAGDGKDFGAFTKMVKSLGASGLSGPLLYQTAFNAFAAVTGTDRATLLASADELSQRLADDRARVQERHREKLGEVATAKPSALVQLREQEARLQADVAALSQQLADKTQQLHDTQQQAQQERTKAQSALASYELAHAAAAAELQAHQQATNSFLLTA